MEQKQRIYPELQKWFDDGWEAIGDVDESGLRWEYYKEIQIEPFHVFLCFFFIGFLLILFDILSPSEIERVVEYRISLRRLKSHG